MHLMNYAECDCYLFFSLFFLWEVHLVNLLLNCSWELNQI